MWMRRALLGGETWVKTWRKWGSKLHWCPRDDNSGQREQREQALRQECLSFLRNIIRKPVWGLEQIYEVQGKWPWALSSKMEPDLVRSWLFILKEWDTFGKKQKYGCSQGFPSGSVVKNPPAMQETWVQSLGQEDPLEKEMATHSSILAWRIPWTEEPGRPQSIRSQRGRHHWVTEHVYTLDCPHFWYLGKNMEGRVGASTQDAIMIIQVRSNGSLGQSGASGGVTNGQILWR